VGPNDNKSPQAFAPLTSALVDERAKALLTPDDFDASGKLLPGKVPTAFEEKSASFTAQNGGHYRTTGTITVTDSPSPVAGHYYVVLVQSGTATIGGTGFAASRIPIYRYYNGTTWVTLPISVDWAELANIPANITTWAGKTPPTGDAVGTTDTQTLTNKTLTSPVINSPKIQFDPKSANFTAEAFGHYCTTGTVTVTDPASPNAGHYYFVLVQSGTATIGGVAFGPSRFPIYRYYNGSSWVTLPVSVATDATFNGSNNTAPNQTAASASSLMTRALSDARYLSFADLRVIQSNTVSVANSGAGSSASGNNLESYARGNPGTADNGYARMTVARLLNNTLGSGSGIKFFLPIRGAFLIFAGCYPTSPEKSFRIIFGGNAGVPAPADSNALSVMGFGMEIKYESGSPKWRLFAHNGTTYTTSPSWQTFPGNPSSLDDFVACVIESNGAGTISARVGYGVGPNADLRNAAVHSITGGPTGTGGANDSYVDLVVVNPTTGGPHYSAAGFTIISRPQFYI
jgi:hypothetical protein